jgi:hypothetical protein
MCFVYGIAPQALLSGSREFDRNKQTHKTVKRKQAGKKPRSHSNPKVQKITKTSFWIAGVQKCKPCVTLVREADLQ